MLSWLWGGVESGAGFFLSNRGRVGLGTTHPGSGNPLPCSFFLAGRLCGDRKIEVQKQFKRISKISAFGRTQKKGVRYLKKYLQTPKTVQMSVAQWVVGSATNGASPSAELGRRQSPRKCELVQITRTRPPPPGGKGSKQGHCWVYAPLRWGGSGYRSLPSDRRLTHNPFNSYQL